MNSIILIVFPLVKVPIDSDYSLLTEEIEASHKAINLKLVTESELLIKKCFSWTLHQNWSKEIFVIDSLLKTNP